jgi:hypothetical protein
MQATYYWEHANDESRCLRGKNAQELAEVMHASGGEVGVIVDTGDDAPLIVRRVEAGRSVRDTAARMTAESRSIMRDKADA